MRKLEIMRRLIFCLLLFAAVIIYRPISSTACGAGYEGCLETRTAQRDNCIEGCDDRLNNCYCSPFVCGMCTGCQAQCGQTWQACVNTCNENYNGGECECYQGFCDYYAQCF